MNIFVANLNFKLQEDELLDLFENFGEVSSAKIIIDRETGRSKGFGFVEMDNDDEANSAIADLNGQEVHGREMVVKQAEDRPRRERRF
ncbi:RNA-binding protein [Salibacter sp.]|jgi:RNA recognition motif-containing protein|uniref:RNA recognition motif domain-containing protein n=1 Tax=Salibacter sp. TaxID=2010995 RepID=UPI0028704931|nr:RNA-binding protein [Salibacter sp.]MDR9397685.1 RNA-binding protein [Salibacter sp.]MDR9488146.1 RNA-binding protein [Salibacter sp.]